MKASALCDDSRRAMRLSCHDKSTSEGRARSLINNLPGKSKKFLDVSFFSIASQTLGGHHHPKIRAMKIRRPVLAQTKSPAARTIKEKNQTL